MRKKSGVKQELCASFYAAAKLNCTLAELKRRMLLFPDTRILADGLTIRCSVGGSLLDFRSDGITYSYYFESESKRNKGTNMVKFLSILAYLKELYEVRIDCMYDPLLEVIGDSLLLLHDGNGYDETEKERIRSLSGSNTALSRELLSLYKRKEEIERQAGILGEFSKSIIEKFSNGASKERTKEILLKAGVSEQLCDDVLRELWRGV